MSKWLVVVLLVVIAGNAQAEWKEWDKNSHESGWQQMGEDELSTHYVMFRSVKVRNDSIRIWELVEFKEQKDSGFLTPKSMLFLSEGDCKGKRYKRILTVMFSGPFATGMPLHGEVGKDWEPTPPENSKAFIRWRSFCENIDKLRYISD